MAHLSSAAPALPRSRGLGTALAVSLLVLTVVALMTISAELLANFGYHYTVPGGLPWEKIHPATVFATLALLARILGADRPALAASRLVGRDPIVLLYLLTIVIAAGHAAIVSKTPVTTLIDTFILPVLVFWLLRGLDPRVRRTLGLLVCMLMALNATIGLAEYLSGWRLVPVPGIDASGIDPDNIDPTLDIGLRAALSDWRATALLGHPLENAVLTGVFVVCLSSPGVRWLPTLVRYPLLAISVLSMVAFGGRTSLVLSLVAIALLAAVAAARMLVARTRISRRIVGGVALGVPIIAAIAVLSVNAGFLDRLVARFIDDAGSANSRLVMWDMLAPLSWNDLLFGPDPALNETTQRILGVELGIESFWLAITLIFGLIVAAMLFLSLGLFMLRVVMLSGPGAGPVMVFYFLVASTSTSLSSKTTGLSVTVLMVMVLLQRERSADFWLPRWLRVVWPSRVLSRA